MVNDSGKCWCECGEDVGKGAFFVQGHDKRAEARVIKDVFGGVPQFMIAYGYGPDRETTLDTPTTSWTEAVRFLHRLLAVGHREVVVEFRNPEEPDGALLRSNEGHFRCIVRLTNAKYEERAVELLIDNRSIVWVPFVDIIDVYRDRRDFVVRVSGTLAPSQNGGWEYWGYGSHLAATPSSEKLERLAFGSLAEVSGRPGIRCAVAFISAPNISPYPQRTDADAPQPVCANVLQAPMLGNIVCQGFDAVLTPIERRAVESRFPRTRPIWTFVG